MEPLRAIDEGVWQSGPVRSGLRPVLCVPGFLGDARVFAPFAEALGGRHVVALDLGPGDHDELVARVQGWVDRLEPELVTGSFGGLLARGVRGMASWATVGTLPSRAWLSGGVVAQRRLLQRLPGAVVSGMYRRHTLTSARADGLPDALARALAARGLDKATLVERLRIIETWPFDERPDVPTLWLAGATDPQVRWTRDQALEALGTGVTCAVVPGSHRPHASHPGPMVTRLEGFWRSGA